MATHSSSRSVLIDFEDFDIDKVLGPDWKIEDIEEESEWTDEDGDDESDEENVRPNVDVQRKADEEGKPSSSTTTNNSSSRPRPTSSSKGPKKKAKIDTFVCPLCKKHYKSSSGFRGHVTKLHNRPDIKASSNKTQDVTDKDDRDIPIPLGTEDEINIEMPSILSSALNAIVNEDRHRQTGSRHGKSMVEMGHHVLCNAAKFLPLLVRFVVPVLAMMHIPSSFVKEVTNLRNNREFFQEFIGQLDFDIQKNVKKMFCQRLLTSLIKAFLTRQNEIITKERKREADKVTENDKQVLHYVCGFILRKLRKKFYRSKVLLAMIMSLTDLTKIERDPRNSWSVAVDRQGLTYPSKEFLNFIINVEAWTRGLVGSTIMKNDSMVSLLDTILEFKLLKKIWCNQVIPAEEGKKWLILEYVISTFLKIRGFAVARQQKEILKRKKAQKKAAGSKRALRKELCELQKTKTNQGLLQMTTLS